MPTFFEWEVVLELPLGAALTEHNNGYMERMFVPGGVLYKYQLFYDKPKDAIAPTMVFVPDAPPPVSRRGTGFQSRRKPSD